MEQQQVAPLSAGVSALDRAVERASGWLLERYGEEVEWAIEDQFLIGLDDQERIDLEEQLQARSSRDQSTFFANAMSCILAQGRFEPDAEEGDCRSFSFADKLLGRGGLLLEVTERQWLEALVGSTLQLYRIGRLEGDLIPLDEVTSRERVRVEPHPAMEPLEEGDLVGARVVTLEGEKAGRLCGVFGFPTGDAERDLIDLVETAAAHSRGNHGEILGIAEVVATAWLRSFLPDASTRGLQALVDGGGASGTRRVLEWPVSDVSKSSPGPPPLDS